MKRFTDAVRQSLESRNWYAALTLTLTLPDICGSIDHPGVKSGPRYIQWFDQHLRPFYTSECLGRSRVFLTGADCFALRCSYLHAGADDTTDEWVKERYTKYHFTTTQGHLIDLYGVGLVLNVRQFCTEVCDAVDAWAQDRGRDEAVQKQFDGLLRIQTGAFSPVPGMTMNIAPD